MKKLILLLLFVISISAFYFPVKKVFACEDYRVVNGVCPDGSVPGVPTPLPTVVITAQRDRNGCSDSNLSDVEGLFSVRYCNVNTLIVRVIQILLAGIAGISALMIIVGGYRYVISAGNPEAAKKGRQTITYAIIGLLVSVLAYTLIAIVNNTINR